MKQIRKFSFRRVIAAFSVAALLFGSGCTRDDADNVLGKSADGPIRFQVNTTSALTKGGSANAVEHLGSTLFDVVDGNELYLSLESTPWEVDAATKVAPYKDKGDLTSVSFGMAVYKQDTETSPLGDLHGGPVEAPYGGSYWEPTTTILWPDLGKKVHFFVYAPYNSSLTMSATTGTEPTLAGFVVSDAATTQKDLLYARDVTNDSNPLVLNGGGAMEAYKITFEHALAAIRFKVIESAGITVTSVKVRGVYDGGTLNMNTGEWTGLSKSGSTITITSPSTTSDGNGYALFDEKYTLMMIPNISGDDNRHTAFEGGAEIEVNYTVGGVNKTITTSITSHQWRQGYMLTYVIGDYTPIGEYDYFFSVAEQPTMNYTGKLSDNGKIISYKQLKSDPTQKTALGWTIEGYYNTLSGAQNATVSDRIAKGAAGTFIKDFIPEVGNGSITGEQVKISYPGAEYTERIDVETGSARNAKIAAATPKGSATQPFNLADPSNPTSNNVVNTANTYIINAAGYYKFPIVMGNGVKNGALNSDAYSQTGFVDYKNRAITDPYLRGAVAAEVPTIAFLNWADQKDMIAVVNQDANSALGGGVISNFYLVYPNLINGISKTTDAIGDVYWVNFHVPTATKQGTAQIIVRDASGENMWTWLIWLTDLKLGEGDIEVDYLTDATNASSVAQAHLMDRNLGWVDDATQTTYKYPAATPAYMRLVQNESGEVAVVELTRPAKNFVESTYTHSPYYQWGRNAAILPGGINESDPTNGVEPDFNKYVGFYKEFFVFAGPTTLAESIQKSSFFIINSSIGDWMASRLHTLWNATPSLDENIDVPVVKTIYDPCPVGYTVPRVNIFTFARIGVKDAHIATNVKEVDATRGLTFYTNFRESESVAGTGEIYFPVSGRRTARSGALADMFHGRYYTSSTTDVYGYNNTAILQLDLTDFHNWLWQVQIFAPSSKAIGHFIRPQREE